MTNWITHPQTLSGKVIELISMTSEHFPELIALANDKRIWQHYTYDGTDPARFKTILEGALTDMENGSQFSFVIFHKQDKKLIGSTRFMEIQYPHRKLEIGSTWLHPDYWGTAVNFECKLLLLTFCFETLGTLRVQLRTDENNIRSQKAIEKIGGQYEGTFRNDMFRDNGTHRNSMYYSIIASEWKEKKIDLTRLFETKFAADPR
jgi:RimJ/RimL family protein N-acetyltransferase